MAAMRKVKGGHVVRDGRTETFYPKLKPRVVHVLITGDTTHIGKPVLVCADFDRTVCEGHPLAGPSCGTQIVEFIPKSWVEHRLRALLLRIDERLDSMAEEYNNPGSIPGDAKDRVHDEFAKELDDG